MDDDIDIEEHDLLDNPAIRKLFPDLSILKKELEYFEEASEIKKDPDINEYTTENEENDTVSDSIESHTEKIEISHDVLPESDKIEEAPTPLLGNKIILGSKPTKPPNFSLKHTAHRNMYVARVRLNDIGSYLARSEKFCKICLTMFPQKRDIEIHKAKMHIQNNMFNMTEARKRNTVASKVKTFKCDKCSESFLQQSILRRHMINVHRKEYTKSLKNGNHTSLQLSSPLRKRMVNSTKLNQCFHCKVKFSSKRLLIEHIYKVLQTTKSNGTPGVTKQQKKDKIKTTLNLSNRVSRNNRKRDNVSNRHAKINNSNIKNKNLPIRPKRTESLQKDKKFKTKIPVFRCVYCAYYFSNMQFCIKHIVNKHKDFSITEVRATVFDEQCKYCSKKNHNWKLHNKHMQMNHKEKIDGTVKIYPKICLPKIDQILPKKKATEQKDIIDNDDVDEMDFSESLDSEEHNEDEESNFVNNNQLVLKSILFKCKRCDIHFLSAKSAMNHAGHMELLINWKCLSCNKIFKKVDKKLHIKQHSFSNDFTVFELTESQLARVLYRCSKCAIHFDSNGYLPHSKKCEISVAESIYCKVCDIFLDKYITGSHVTYHNKKKLKSTDFTILSSDAITKSIHEVINPAIKKSSKKKIQVPQFSFKLSYCKTCNSFISKKGRNRIVHMESRCAHLPTYICELCGLIFTSKTMVTHKIMHKDKKDIRLQDFSFYAFGNSKQILPPIPEYPKCKSCHVHFISKVAVINHLCSEDFLTCHICNIKLSEPVFKLHMSFHYYSKTSKRENDLSQDDMTNLTNISETCKEIRRPARPLPRKEISAPGPSTKSDECHGSELNQAVNKQLPEKNQSDEIECMKVNNQNNESPNHIPEAASDEYTLTCDKNINSVQTSKISQKYKTSDFVLFNVLYCCTNCRTTIDTYDAVVEHCQDHLCGVEIEKIECETCKIKLDQKSYVNHKEFHVLKVTNKSIQLLEFDTFYFTLDNNVWIKHVFKNLDDEISQLILNRSIYKYCVKMKMQVIQEGLCDITVYKCNSCFVIVDPDSLLKHVENSCFKTRKHPCSYCGLPFMSYISLKKHLNIHKKMNISLKSYRIVIINQEKHKKINKAINGLNKYFLLYKCRNCNGVIDMYQRQNHILCNDKDLKKCLVCDLLFYSADYKAHMHKHELVSNFVPKNMKIVLFGQSPANKIVENPINQTIFGGTIVDFTFIQCVKCGVCLEKSPITTLNHHTCYEDSVMSKCSKCDLYILKSKIARHTKLHDNVHFVKDNMNIIPYDHSEHLTKFIPADVNKLNDQELDRDKTCDLQNDKITDYCNKMKDLNKTINITSSPTADKNLTICEKTTKLLKCSCGLHFLDKTSIEEHFDQCNSKISKQHCSKCNLLFTPTVLFTHLLLHHGDKKYIYKFNIIEMSKEKNEIVTLYNCVNCKTHFMEYDTATMHFENCKEIKADRKECIKCKLLFSSCSITQHETLHHDKQVADIEIVDVTNKNILDTDNKIDTRLIDNVIKQADLVRESKFNISDENLSQIDLSRYSNTIYKCETCNTHFLTHNTFKNHFSNGKHILSPQDTCNFCELSFSLQSLTKHIYIHHQKMKLNSIDFVINCNV